MPSIFEQLAAAGIELNDEQRAKINIEEADEVKGLVNSRNTLIEEKKQAKALAEQAERDRQAAIEAQAAKDGDVETLRKQYADREAAYVQKLQDRDNRILGKERDLVLAEVSGDFIVPEGGRLMIKDLVKTGYTESGDVTTEYFDEKGQSLGNDKAKFIKYLSESETFSPFMKGIDSNGGGAIGNRGVSGQGSAKAKSLGGTKQERVAALKARYPDLN